MSNDLNLNDLVGQLEEKPLPPLEKWNPPFCGDLDMRIARDGRWFYLGSEIKRKPLVKMFSTILLFEGGEYFMLTPVEKYRIKVEDVPFVAVSVNPCQHGDRLCLAFETNVGDLVVLGKNNPMHVKTNPNTGEPSPYILVRKNLEALISRNVFYQLVDQAELEQGESNELFISSDGERFSLGTF